MESSCINNFLTFLEQLRSHGMVVGVAEALDAFRLIDGGLLRSRSDTRFALCCLLAKSEREQEIFFQCFDEYFVPASVSREREEAELIERAEHAAAREKIMEELTFEGRPIELSDELREVYADMDEQRREKLKNYLGMSTENERRSPFTYNFMRRILEQHLRMEESMYDTADDAAVGSDSGSLLYKDISKIGEDEMPRAVSLIQNLVKQLSGSISRAYRRSGRRGRLDFRATIRAGLATGGFYRLKYRRRRRSKKKLVLLCDVSGSMLKYSEFAIRFLKSMSDVSESSRTFIFSEDLLEAGPFVLSNMDSFQSYVKGSGLWGKGTDIAAAVDKLMSLRPAVLGGNAVLIIISDTKSVKLGEARAAVQRAARAAGRTIWLNPIPERKWLKMSSVTQFHDLCDMLDCSTIHELSRACAKSLTV